jgi:hypothetical protein
MLKYLFHELKIHLDFFVTHYERHQFSCDYFVGQIFHSSVGARGHFSPRTFINRKHVWFVNFLVRLVSLQPFELNSHCRLGFIKCWGIDEVLYEVHYGTLSIHCEGPYVLKTHQYLWRGNILSINVTVLVYWFNRSPCTPPTT